jgi:hypothetical protein
MGLRDETIAKLTGVNKKPEETIDGVKKQADDMDVIDKAMGTARKLSGAEALQDQLDRKDKKIEEVEQQRDKATEEKNKAQIETVRTELGTKIDDLVKSLAAGGSKQSIAEQIKDIKQAATELNLGGSKISEIKDMMTLIDSLNPKKSLADQIKDAKELITILAPPADKEKEFSIGGMPATVALELKKMDSNLQITLENMKDERQRKDQDFQLTLKKWDDERELRRGEIAGKIAVERERNKMVSDGLQLIGRAGGKAILDGLKESPPATGGVSGHIELGEGESGEFSCPNPNCNSPIAVGPTSTLATCATCKSQFPITRIVRSPAAEEE